MKLRCWLGSVALACGCAGAPLKQANAPTAPVPVHAHEPAPPPVLELPSLGLQLRAPGPVEAFDGEYPAPDGFNHTEGVTCTANAQDYFVARTFRGARDRAADAVILAAAKKELKTVSREAPVQMGEWAGVELEGKKNSGHEAWLRLYVVGDGFWLAQVERSQGALDRAAARAFFDSIVLSQPWSVHAFPEGHFSARLPDGAVRLDKKVLHAEAFTVGEASWVGGSENRVFLVWSMPLDAGSRTAEERIQGAADALVSDGNRIIWQAPIIVDTAAGRDFLMQSKDAWVRLRVIVTASDLYMLQATARTKEALLDDSVQRFLASLRWY